MPHPVEKSLSDFRSAGAGKQAAVAAASVPPDPDVVLAELAGWMEPRHTLLLRALLDRTATVQSAGTAGVLRGVHRILGDLRRDARLQYAELRERWETRLEPKALLPLLQRNQWIEAHPGGGVVLAGKGTRKEARMLYLQTAHDMATDCARQWASLAGRLQAYQASIAAEWHPAAVDAADDATRLVPTLEAALREAEFGAWKAMRLSLGPVAEEAFIHAVARRERRAFPDAEALVRGALEPWTRYSPTGNGWSGFMFALSRLGERMTLAMLDHYERKWNLYLRGWPFSPAPEGESSGENGLDNKGT